VENLLHSLPGEAAGACGILQQGAVIGGREEVAASDELLGIHQRRVVGIHMCHGVAKPQLAGIGHCRAP
jgi:hypothetical protein